MDRPATNRADFAKSVEDALSRLDDKRYLDGHPLASQLAPTGKSLDAGALQRVLLDAIRELRPQETGAYHANDWRRYRHLVLRYVEAVPPPEIARQLGVSDRQARRDHHEALEAVTALLWAKCSRAQSTTLATTEEVLDAELEAELNRIGSAPPEGPLELGQVLSAAVSTVDNLARSRNVTIRMSLPAELSPVACNADALRHILLSLLTASIEWDAESSVHLNASDLEGEVEIRLATCRRVKGQHPGPDHPLLETDQAPSLHVASRLAQVQGGRLEVHETQQGELRAHLFLKAFLPATVLVIDDNPDFVRLFRRYVSGAPYRILEAKVPSEAVRLATEAHPDVITLDVMMPSQDGWQILQQLKRLRETCDIPVVVCSVLRERALALSLGATDFLAKPITQQALLSALAKHCGSLSPVPPAGSPSPRRPTAPRDA